MIIKELTRAECDDVLASTQLGRLACAKDDQPYVVPITFAHDGNHLYSFSLVGQKVSWMRDNPKVSVQVDTFSDDRAWKSVVVTGRFEELPDRVGWKVQRDRAWSLLSREAEWWQPGALKPVAQGPTPHIFYRVVIDGISGRRAVPDGSA